MFFDDASLGIDSGLMDGAEVDPPLPDVSNGAPDQQPSTPTGTGTGYWVDPSQESAMWGTVQKALQYAINRDQISMAAKTGLQTSAAGAVVPTAQAAQKIQNQQFLLLLGIGFLAYQIMGHK